MIGTLNRLYGTKVKRTVGLHLKNVNAILLLTEVTSIAAEYVELTNIIVV